MSRVKHVYAKVLSSPASRPKPSPVVDGGTGFCFSQLGIIVDGT